MFDLSGSTAWFHLIDRDPGRRLDACWVGARSARDAGVAPAVVEVETKDGTIIRVFGGESTADNPWDTVLKGDGDHGAKQKRST